MTKFQLRRWWFQVHKWIGLVLALLIIPLSLSGAALVWHDALDRALNPQRFATSGTALLSPDAYAAAAGVRLKPGERLAQLTFPEPGGPVVIAAAGARAAARPGPPQRTNIWLDPPTARVLDVASSAAGLVRFVHVLHGSLQLPGGWGRTIVGWLGVAMMVSAFTGLWLWWPTVGRVVRGLRWRRRPDTNANLHHLFGFWIALPLFMLSLTGAWIAFPAFFGAITGEGGQRGRQPPAPPVARTTLTPGIAVARAQAIAPGPVRSIGWPTALKPDWTIQLGGGADGGNGPVTVSVADDDDVAVVTPPLPGRGGIARLMRRLHDGDDMGPVWQAMIFVAGLLPALLAVTGIVMWWRMRRWRGRNPSAPGSGSSGSDLRRAEDRSIPMADVPPSR